MKTKQKDFKVEDNSNNSNIILYIFLIYKYLNIIKRGDNYGKRSYLF